MAGTQERDELHAVHSVLEVARAVSEDSSHRTRQRPAWIGAGHAGPDLASRAKDALRNEMGQRRA